MCFDFLSSAPNSWLSLTYSWKSLSLFSPSLRCSSLHPPSEIRLVFMPNWAELRFAICINSWWMTASFTFTQALILIHLIRWVEWQQHVTSAVVGAAFMLMMVSAESAKHVTYFWFWMHSLMMTQSMEEMERKWIMTSVCLSSRCHWLIQWMRKTEITTTWVVKCVCYVSQGSNGVEQSSLFPSSITTFEFAHVSCFVGYSRL